MSAALQERKTRKTKPTDRLIIRRRHAKKVS